MKNKKENVKIAVPLEEDMSVGNLHNSNHLNIYEIHNNKVISVTTVSINKVVKSHLLFVIKNMGINTIICNKCEINNIFNDIKIYDGITGDSHKEVNKYLKYQ